MWVDGAGQKTSTTSSFTSTMKEWLVVIGEPGLMI
jgi:hypothetical protein